MFMYRVTRDGEPVAGSRPAPYEAAILAAMLLNKEYKRRDLFDVEPDHDATSGERAPYLELVGEVGSGVLSGTGVLDLRGSRLAFAGTTC